jgi:formyl-CoA transferase
MTELRVHPEPTVASGVETTPPASGPLAGLRVLELGSLIAGPFAGRLLADMGATVIKVESPDRPDPMRDWGHGSKNGRRVWWPVLSRNKRCVTINLRDPAGQDVFRDLARSSDAVIENFRPGTLERWNLGYDQLRAINEALILVRVSGYGQTGPYASRPGFASVGEAMGGLRYLNGEPGEIPPRMGISLGDSLAAMYAVQGLLAALYHRERTGQGQEVDVSILESCFSLLESVVPEYTAFGLVREPTGPRLSGIAPSNVYKSSDGRHIVIAANQDTLFARLCAAMERPDLAEDPRFADHRARGEHQDAIDAEVRAWAARHTAAEIDDLLATSGVVCGPIYSVADIVADPHVQARDMLVAHDDPEIGTFLGPGMTPRFGGTPGVVRWTGRWQAGADNDAVYGELLGYDADRRAELRDAGAI